MVARNRVTERDEMNPEEITLPPARSKAYFFHGQLGHLLSLTLLLILLWTFASPHLGDNTLFGKSDAFWLWVAVALAIMHQILGWLVFRAQLGWAVLTRWLGEADLAVWGLIFLPMLLGRLVLLLMLGIADYGSIVLPSSITLPLAVLLTITSLYTGYSVLRFFGLERALGGDHFRKKYREMPLVREAAFRFSENAMYAYAFLALWSIALFTRSQAALALALFQHAYVWVHYLFTEKPDMGLLYPDVKQ